MFNKGIILALQSLGIDADAIMGNVQGVAQIAGEIDARMTRIETTVNAIAAHLGISTAETAIPLIEGPNSGQSDE